MSYISMLAILIIFLTTENPDLYRDQKTKFFNKNAFDVIGSDYLLREEQFNSLIVSVYNYKTATELYGQKQLYDALSRFGETIIQKFPDYYVFYSILIKEISSLSIKRRWARISIPM